MNILNQAKEVTMVPVDELVVNPRNPNRHSKEQIERLCLIIQHQGFRNPLIVSNQSLFIVAGHGRLEAAKKLGMKEVPVLYQDFETPEQEYQAIVADNSLASWSELDLSMINQALEGLGPFDISLLGIEDFTVDPVEKLEPEIEKEEKPKTPKECPSCGYEF